MLRFECQVFGQPVRNLHHNLVHAVRGGAAPNRIAMVAGRIVVDGGRLLSAELRLLIDRANAAPGLFQRWEAWLAELRVVSELPRG